MQRTTYIVCFISLLISTSIFSQKPKITQLEDMPVFTYEIPVKPSEFVQQDQSFKIFADNVAIDVQSVLDGYDISDKTTLKQLYGTLLSKAILDGDADKMLDLIFKRRALMEKEVSKLMSGLTSQTIAESWKEKNSLEYDQVKNVFREKYTKVINELPWDLVQDRVEQIKGIYEIISPNFYIGSIQARQDLAYEKTGNVSSDAASGLIRIRSWLIRILDFKNDIIYILDKYIKENRVEKSDIWADRSVTFDGSERYNPVLICVWDAGVDASVFNEQMWNNEQENVNGQDTDNNGFIDDIHGIAFDLDEYYSKDLLYPLSKDQKNKYPHLIDQTKGIEDIIAAIDTEESQKLKKYMASLTPKEMAGFMEELTLISFFSHGTHVAGIAVDGNPYAKILGVRITFDHHPVPAPPSVEQAKRASKNYMKTVKYMQQNGVRAANMSWGWTFSEIEGMLEANGIGKDANDRREKTRKIFNIYKEGLFNAIKSAPGILFVTAAGNEDNNVEFDQVIPSSFDLPNLLVVGAVDQAGEETSFTSFGDQVTLHANGFEVESYLPGGRRIKYSGTSMASPNVVNLVGKLLAINPKLTPKDVIDIINQGVEKSENGRIFLINPKKSAEILINSNMDKESTIINSTDSKAIKQ